MKGPAALDQVKLSQAEGRNVLDPVVDPDNVVKVPEARPPPGYLHTLPAEVEVNYLGVGIVQLLRQEYGHAPGATAGNEDAEMGPTYKWKL